MVLSDEYIDKLLATRQETDVIDSKLDMDISNDSFAKIVKDVAAMANGEQESDLVIGVDDDYNMMGFDPGTKIDETDVRTKLAKYLVPPVNIEYKEVIRKNYLGIERKFAVIHILPSREIVLPKQDGKWSDGNKERTEFRVNDVLVRSGSRSIKAGAFEFNQLLERRFVTKAVESQMYDTEFKKSMAERAKPMKKEELLVLNVFPVTKLPDLVWRGETDLANKNAVFEFLRQIPVPNSKIPRFVVREGRILTFSTLSDGANPLRIAVNSRTIDTTRTSEMLSDPDKANWIVDLLNSCLRKHCEERGISYDRDGEKYYYKMPAGQQRFRDRYTLAGRSYPRTLAKYNFENKVVVHNGVNLRFTRFGQTLSLLVMPGLVFTSDGSQVISDGSTGALATHLLSGQYNQSILRDIRMWVSKISQPEPTIKIADFGFGIQVSTNHLRTEMHVGYNDEEDVLEPEESSDEEESEQEVAAEEQALGEEP